MEDKEFYGWKNRQIEKLKTRQTNRQSFRARGKENMNKLNNQGII